MSCSIAAVATACTSSSLRLAGARQQRRMPLQPPQVQPRALVGGVDGQRQRLDGREVEVGQPLHGVLLLIHPLDVGAIGAIAEPEREGAERRQPEGRSIDRGDRERGGGGAEDVGDPAAQHVAHPQAEEGLPAGGGQRAGDDAGVDDVVGRGGGAERDGVGCAGPTARRARPRSAAPARSAAMVTARAAMLNTVRCHGFRARKTLKVVWLQAATMAISVALGPSRMISEAKFAAKASDIVSGWPLSDAGIGTATLKTEVRTARTSNAPNVIGCARCRPATADAANQVPAATMART